MPQQPRSFIIKRPMCGYSSNDRRTGVQLLKGEVYTATYVGEKHLLVIHPERPTIELAVPVATPFWWKQIVFEPEVCGLAALFNQPRPTEQR